MYRIERRDQLYKTLPKAAFFSPTIVIFSAITLLLPLSGVFAPGSLTVTTKNYTDAGVPCMIPTGHPLTQNITDSTFGDGTAKYYSDIMPKARELTMQLFVEQHIPDLPQACGPNCCYNVLVPSFVFQCTPNPPLLPYAQAGIPSADPLTPSNITLWNGTMIPLGSYGFYIAWKSNGPNGTSGNASCEPVLAHYDVKVWTIA
jgi:hypothetical protein